MEFNEFLGIQSNEPSKNLAIHLDSEVLIKDKNKNGDEVNVKLTRGYNTIADLTSGQIIDPKYPG